MMKRSARIPLLLAFLSAVIMPTIAIIDDVCNPQLNQRREDVYVKLYYFKFHDIVPLYLQNSVFRVLVATHVDVVVDDGDEKTSSNSIWPFWTAGAITSKPTLHVRNTYTASIISLCIIVTMGCSWRLLARYGFSYSSMPCPLLLKPFSALRSNTWPLR